MPSVLIVDDDVDLLEMVSTVISIHGMDVNCITSGRAFLASIAEFNPDLVLMDVFLDDGDGRKLCLNLKNSPSLKHIPVILYSAGLITPASIQESMANEFLVKPFEIQDLMDKINHLISQKGQDS
jgi:DNA-binding response OmpR family regulator